MCSCIVRIIYEGLPPRNISPKITSKTRKHLQGAGYLKLTVLPVAKLEARQILLGLKRILRIFKFESIKF